MNNILNNIIEKYVGLSVEQIKIMTPEERKKYIFETSGSYPEIDTKFYYEGISCDEKHILNAKETNERFYNLLKEEKSPKQFVKSLFKNRR